MDIIRTQKDYAIRYRVGDFIANFYWTNEKDAWWVDLFNAKWKIDGISKKLKKVYAVNAYTRDIVLYIDGNAEYVSDGIPQSDIDTISNFAKKIDKIYENDMKTLEALERDPIDHDQ